MHFCSQWEKTLKSDKWPSGWMGVLLSPRTSCLTSPPLRLVGVGPTIRGWTDRGTAGLLTAPEIGVIFKIIRNFCCLSQQISAHFLQIRRRPAAPPAAMTESDAATLIVRYKVMTPLIIIVTKLSCITGCASAPSSNPLLVSLQRSMSDTWDKTHVWSKQHVPTVGPTWSTCLKLDEMKHQVDYAYITQTDHT